MIAVLPFSSEDMVEQPVKTEVFSCVAIFTQTVHSELSEQTCSLRLVKLLICAKPTTRKNEVFSLVVPYMLTGLVPLMMEIRN